MPTRMTAPSGRPRALVITAESQLLDDLLRLAAAAGVEVDLAAEPGLVDSPWSAAGVILVGADLAAVVARRRLPRRPGVLVVGGESGGLEVPWRAATELSAESVVLLPDGEAWLVERLADSVEPPGEHAATLAVVGGRGGAGASTLAVLLSLTAVRAGHSCTLVDLDPWGGGLDLVLGLDDAPGLRWGALNRARGRLDAAGLRGSLPCVDGLPVLACDRDGVPIERAAVDPVLAALRRSDDLVVLDLPRHLDDAARDAMRHADRIVLVVPAQVRAVAAARATHLSMNGMGGASVVVVRGPVPTGLDAEMVAASVGLPLAGSFRDEPGLAGAAERGDPPRPRSRSSVSALCAGLIDLSVTHRAAAA